MVLVLNIVTFLVCTVLPRCYALLAVTPPPPIFGRKYYIGLFYLHYTPPPRATRAGLRCCSSCTCTCVASVEDTVYQACRK